MSLAKRPHCADNLGDIVKDDGSPFESKQERDSYIKEHFASTYRRVPDTVNEQSINNFLGDVANREEVLASKLNQDERDELESRIEITEFDAAIEKAKLNTSPGIDSISNRFIKTFWYIFRKPLFDYAQCCYDKGILTENFRCAKIRLIPKKGDTSLLKNWRPISLLNCFYKLISRVVALRLKKVIDKITQVAQKGFSSTKYCQEVLIGIVDSINHLKYKRKQGFLLSLDIKKAFNSTSHSYLQEVYKFFNFGPNFIRWLNLIGTNRKACIIMENGLYSEFFYLERGNAQGDMTSPYIFNLGFKILLLKLTFDLQIEGSLENPPLADGTPPLPPTVSTYTRKVSAYADDANMIVKNTYETLARIKEILETFGAMSGLVCNVEKTSILPIGDNTVVDDRIRDLGFVISEKITVLGLVIDKDGYTDENFSNIRNKLTMQVNKWRPYGLSLPGRVLIAKCMLYSQLNYIGCIIKFPSDYVEMFDRIIVDFVKGKLNIAKKRLYTLPEHGGIGLFNIDDFLDAQRCSWIKRSINLNELWKIILFTRNFGNVYNAKSRNINVLEYPICHGICMSYEKMSENFTTVNENYKNCYIFENGKLTIDLTSRETLNRDGFTNEFFGNNAAKLFRLKYCDFYTDDGDVIDNDAVREITGINFTVLKLFRIRNVCVTAKTRYKKNEISMQKSVDIITFLHRRKGAAAIFKNLRTLSFRKPPRTTFPNLRRILIL